MILSRQWSLKLLGRQASCVQPLHYNRRIFGEGALVSPHPSRHAGAFVGSPRRLECLLNQGLYMSWIMEYHDRPTLSRWTTSINTTSGLETNWHALDYHSNFLNLMLFHAARRDVPALHNPQKKCLPKVFFFCWKNSIMVLCRVQRTPKGTNSSKLD
jgi:hypothetical protein